MSAWRGEVEANLEQGRYQRAGGGDAESGGFCGYRNGSSRRRLCVFNETNGLETISIDDVGDPLTLFGTKQMSSTMRGVTFSPGFCWVFVTATWSP